MNELRILRNFSNMDDEHCSKLVGYLKATNDNELMEVKMLSGWGLATKTNYDYLDREYPNIFLFNYPNYIYGGNARVIVPNLDNEVCDSLIDELTSLNGYPLLDEESYDKEVDELRVNEAKELHKYHSDISEEALYYALYEYAKEDCGALDYYESEVLDFAKNRLTA